MFEEKVTALSQMTAEHMAMPFPPGLRGLDIAGHDLVMLDADAYGYAVRVLNGSLDEQRHASLTRMTTVLEKVLAAIEDEYATTYYTHVRDLAALAVEVETLRGR
ncbi:hypothetical protein [Streptosporangium sp. NPDC000239]|uniref:hypothetical protein n=1 Tax=unclassified Streptosporangium TaxID=2632669 RepID=UPI003325DF28